VAPALECDQRYATLPIGSGLLGSGGALTVAGVVLLALPGSRSK
jgi:homoserine kinase